MQISKESACYKVATRYTYVIPKTLCQLISNVIGSLFVTTVLFGFITAGLIGLAMIVFDDTIGLFTYTVLNEYIDLHIFLIFGLVLCSVLTAIIIVIMFFFIVTILDDIQISRTDIYKKSSVLLAWFKSKKEKICPIIEWEE